MKASDVFPSKYLSQKDFENPPQKPRGDWMRRRELKAATGMSKERLAEAIMRGRQNGTIETRKLPVPDVTGRVNMVPHYRVKGKR